MNSEKFKEYAPVVLRIGLSAVFLWFGITQLINPESFLGYIPNWIYPHDPVMIHEHAFQSLHNLPLTPHIIVMGNGALETILGLLLGLGLFVRIAALILGLHLLVIGASLGYNDIAVRDIGLAIATFSVMLHGKDKYCIKKK